MHVNQPVNRRTKAVLRIQVKKDEDTRTSTYNSLPKPRGYPPLDRCQNVQYVFQASAYAHYRYVHLEGIDTDFERFRHRRWLAHDLAAGKWGNCCWPRGPSGLGRPDSWGGGQGAKDVGGLPEPPWLWPIGYRRPW